MFKQSEIENIGNVKNKIIQQLNDIQTTTWGRYVMSHRRHLYLTGGTIGSLLRGEEVNDWDFYFKDQRVAKDVRNTIINKYRDSIKEYSSDKYPGVQTEDIDGNKDKLITNNAITMEGNVQLITVLSGEPNELLKSFDYVHCMPYFDCGDNKLYISEKQYYACINKVLIVNNVQSATKNTHRKEKFIQRGFKEMVNV